MHAPIVLLFCAVAPSAVQTGESAADAWVVEAKVLIGTVVSPDGVPCEGAIVVTSAGGQTVTDARGEFRLEARLALDAETVQVTAVADDAGRSLVAGARVGIVGSGATWCGTLFLAQGGGCQSEWLPTFGGLPGVGGAETPWVHDMVVFDDGSGPALYVGGDFTIAGDATVKGVAKWDGSDWSALGSNLNGTVYALAVFDDGGGPELYAGGFFSLPGGGARIARWDGSSWSPLTSGVNNQLSSTVFALTTFDDGSGTALYAGGAFIGPVGGSRIAKWNGSSWSALGSGLNDTVVALSVFDDGTGAALYAGGHFTTAGGSPASRIAKWDGSSWSALGSGT